MIFEMPRTAARTASWVALGGLLGRLGGSLFTPFWRLGASWAPLRASLASLWLQSPDKKPATQHIEKKTEKPESQDLGSAARGRECGHVVKRTIPAK